MSTDRFEKVKKLTKEDLEALYTFGMKRSREILDGAEDPVGYNKEEIFEERKTPRYLDLQQIDNDIKVCEQALQRLKTHYKRLRTEAEECLTLENQVLPAEREE